MHTLHSLAQRSLVSLTPVCYSVFLSLSTCLSLCLSVYLPVHSPVFPSVYPSVCLSVHTSTIHSYFSSMNPPFVQPFSVPSYPSFRPFIHLMIQSVFWTVLVHSSISRSLPWFVYSSVCLSVNLPA